MNLKRILILAVICAALILSQQKTAPPALAAPDIFASPVHAGCYLAKADRCKIHVEPFTINIASGKKLVQFQLVTILGRTGAQTIIYDWRPDQSNPVPVSGTTYTPSLVAQDLPQPVVNPTWSACRARTAAMLVCLTWDLLPSSPARWVPTLYTCRRSASSEVCSPDWPLFFGRFFTALDVPVVNK